MLLLRPAPLPLLLLLLAGALLLAEPARAQRDSGGTGGGGPSDSAAGDDDGDEDADAGNDVPSDDEDDAGGGADTTPRAPAPPQTEATTIPLEAAAQETGETSSKEEPVAASPGRLPQYRLVSRGGETCIIMEMDAVVGVFYDTKSKERRDLEEYVDEVKPQGYCGDDEAELIIAWKAFELKWSFSKTPGGERWFVNLVELKYDKADSLFENASSVEDVTLSTRRAHGTMLFPTPVGRSYHCQSEYKLNLSPHNGRGSDSATLLLREFRMQPFMYKQSFGPAFECSPGGAAKYRDETAPIAVGSTLAVVVLLTVTGYGVYRYFKIKKVQYDTME